MTKQLCPGCAKVIDEGSIGVTMQISLGVPVSYSITQGIVEWGRFNYQYSHLCEESKKFEGAIEDASLRRGPMTKGGVVVIRHDSCGTYARSVEKGDYSCIPEGRSISIDGKWSKLEEND